MLFVTNRRLAEGRRSAPGRSVSFDSGDNEPSPSLFFCRRHDNGRLEEVTAAPFLDELRASPRQQLLIFVHGYNCQPEASVFPQALLLQRLCDSIAPELVEVVPLVWPCDDDPGLLLDYWDDQSSAEVSGYAFARLIGKFLDWRESRRGLGTCLKHINLLAHSMGNRVLVTALASWCRERGAVPALFRSIFMAAPDVENETLEPGREGAVVPAAARHLVVYHAADDFALRSSKLANIRNRIISRRLGHTGPEHLEATSTNVVAIDCDAVNNVYDELGHSYFLGDGMGRPGAVLRHVVETIRTGRVAGLQPGRRRLVLERASEWEFM
jgi:esterase/lipase superfamily enzyme